MTLDEIATSLETELSYEKAFRLIRSKHPWIADLLDEAYDAMCSKIKLRSDTKEFLSFDNAASIMDKVTLQMSLIYDRKIAELEHAT